MFLHYTEDISKNHQGNTKGRKLKQKLFSIMQMSPVNRPAGAFYLKPLSKPPEKCWYSKKPIGRNTLEGTAARLCRKAEISGYKIIDSLRVTATRLYNGGVEEQLFME